jgi:hypothetical protein
MHPVVMLRYSEASSRDLEDPSEYLRVTVWNVFAFDSCLIREDS